MDFSEAVFSEMSRILSYVNAGCYVNVTNPFFFPFLSAHTATSRLYHAQWLQSHSSGLQMFQLLLPV